MTELFTNELIAELEGIGIPIPVSRRIDPKELEEKIMLYCSWNHTQIVKELNKWVADIKSKYEKKLESVSVFLHYATVSGVRNGGKPTIDIFDGGRLKLFNGVSYLDDQCIRDEFKWNTAERSQCASKVTGRTFSLEDLVKRKISEAFAELHKYEFRLACSSECNLEFFAEIDGTKSTLEGLIQTYNYKIGWERAKLEELQAMKNKPPSHLLREQNVKLVRNKRILGHLMTLL